MQDTRDTQFRTTEAERTDQQPAAASPVRVSWPHVVLSFLGMGLSAYSVYLHHLIKATGASGCSFTSTISCDKVLGKHGEFLNIPWGVYGFIFFAIVLVTAITTQPLSAESSVVGQRLAVATAGLFVSISLTVFSLTIIRAACPICLATHSVTLLNFLVSLWSYVRTKKAGVEATTLNAPR